MQIRQIIDKIDDHQLFVPAFQREYVWKRPNAKSLFSSLIKKHPTGTLLTWETTKPPELKGDKKYSSEMGAVKLILDGQQRITTIYMIMKGSLPPYYKTEEIKNPVMGLYVNVLTLELEYYKEKQMKNNPVWVNLTDIFQRKIKSNDIRNAVKTLSGLDDQTVNLIDENFETIRAIPEREFPEQIIPVSANIKEAIDIFYIVNSSGVNLTDAELALAQICGYWPEAREVFKKKLIMLEKIGFEFKLDFIIYVLLAVLHDIGSEMKRLHSADNANSIKAAWSRLDTQILDYVVNLLKTHAWVDHVAEINSVFALVPLISFIFKKQGGKLTEIEIKKAIKWFYYSQLRQRYASQTPQKLDKDLSIIKSSLNPFDELLSNIQAERTLEITKDEFVGRDIRHPLFSLMKWYFKSQNAVCLGTGVGLRQNMGAKYTLENDHIFPYGALKDNGYPVENRFKYALAQEIANRAILTKVENREKSDTAAYDYLTEVLRRFPLALDKQCIPADPELWKMANFESFLEARRVLLTGRLNTFLKGITESKLDEITLSIEDVIAEGEHGGLEFKSSLRWAMDESRKNTELERVVLKSISALNNAGGGKLIIGVADDGSILGLESDYATLEDGDKDAFELHLRNLVNHEWGVDYAASNLKIAFPTVSGQEICVVEVKKGKKPLYMMTMDKSGKKAEKFFVRSGNSSMPIENISQITSYISEHFVSS